jgi:hypothetical protein
MNQAMSQSGLSCCCSIIPRQAQIMSPAIVHTIRRDVYNEQPQGEGG